jgi:hypothetical protein
MDEVYAWHEPTVNSDIFDCNNYYDYKACYFTNVPVKQRLA